MPMTYPVVFLSHRSGRLSGYLGNGVRMLRYLGNRYRNHESSRVGSRLVYKEWILDS